MEDWGQSALLKAICCNFTLSVGFFCYSRAHIVAFVPKTGVVAAVAADLSH